nr:atherin-like [Meriones unguiculatus]
MAALYYLMDCVSDRCMHASLLLEQLDFPWCGRGCWRTRGWVEALTAEEEHTGALTAFLLPSSSSHPAPGGRYPCPWGRSAPPEGGGGPGLGPLRRVADAAGPSPALLRCLPLLPAPPPLHPPYPPPGPRQPQLGEQPAAPGLLSLCLGPRGAPGPAQQATRGRRRLRGLAVMEKRERSRPGVTTVTTITITTITDRRPSHTPPHLHLISPCPANFVRPFPLHRVTLGQKDRE